MKTNQTRFLLSQAIAALLLTSTCLPLQAVVDNGASTTIIEPILNHRQRNRLTNLTVRELINSVPRNQQRQARIDATRLANREDVRNLPLRLYKRLLELAIRPHTYLPQTAFAEADGASQLVQHYLLDTDEFQPNIFTSQVEGIGVDGAC